MKQMLPAIAALFLLAPLLQGAAGEEQTPQERFIALKQSPLVQSPNITAKNLIQAFLALDRTSQAEPTYLVPLIKTLLNAETIDPDLIAKLSALPMFQTTGPLGRWLHNREDKHLVADVMAHLDELAPPSKPTRIHFNDSDINEPMSIPLATAQKYSGLLKKIFKDYPSATELPIGGDYFSADAINIVLMLMKMRDDYEEPAYLYNALFSKLPPIDTETLLKAIQFANYLKADSIIISALDIHLKKLMESGQNRSELLNNQIAAGTRNYLSLN